MMNVHNFSELQEAILDEEKEIIIENTIIGFNSIILPQDTTLRGEKGKNAMLIFKNSEGIGLTANNSICDLIIQTATNRKAIFTTISKSDLGHFKFENLTIIGQFYFITRAGVNTAEIEIFNVNILADNLLNTANKPTEYGVDVCQGAITIYNFSGNPKSKITATVNNVSIGCNNTTAIGSGIFVSAFGEEVGWNTLKKLKTKSVYSISKLPMETENKISAAIFIVYGAKAKEIVHNGKIVTYGVNQILLDTQGTVNSWTSNKPIVSYGPSGVGFVNFGKVKKFVVNDPLETYGIGIRDYNQYDSTANDISFQSITTYGNGSIGVQVSKAIGTLKIEENTLTKGTNMYLTAVALSIKQGEEVRKIKIGGKIVTNDKSITTH